MFAHFKNYLRHLFEWFVHSSHTLWKKKVSLLNNPLRAYVDVFKDSSASRDSFPDSNSIPALPHYTGVNQKQFRLNNITLLFELVSIFSSSPLPPCAAWEPSGRHAINKNNAVWYREMVVMRRNPKCIGFVDWDFDLKKSHLLQQFHGFTWQKTRERTFFMLIRIRDCWSRLRQ